MPRYVPVDYDRRRWLTALLLSPLLYGATARAALPATRIIALEWLPVELLNALGVTPLAVAGAADYRIWVRKPALPADMIDVGQRTEPNLELITELKPDLILYSQGYGPDPSHLLSIAPSMGFSFTDDSGHPLTVARASLMALARRLDRVWAAEAHLADFDRQLAEARPLTASYRRQPLLVFSLIDERHALIIGKTNLFGQVTEQLGIDNAWRDETNYWGTAVVGMERLASLPPARAIYMDHGNDAMLSRVAATPLWRSIPFVRQQTWRKAPAIWFYGATLSALRFCRLLERLESSW